MSQRDNEESRRALIMRLVYATGGVAVCVLLGAEIYHLIGQGRWSWWDCLYMTVITVGTVGYGETLDGMADVAGARAFTMALIFFGSGSLVYFISTLTAMIVEGDLRGVLKGRRMQKKIDALKDHVIVCGIGSTGIHVVKELLATHTPFVVIEHNGARVDRAREDLQSAEILNIRGDAADDEMLVAAGIDRCKGVVVALHDDKDNLFVTITARAMNPRARIIVKAIEPSSEAKMRKAGADSVVSPNLIGGMRMVSEMIRPHVVQFLDQMLRDKTQNVRVEELTIHHASPLAGKPLGQSGLRQVADVLVVAVRFPTGDFLYNPKAEHVLTPGSTLVMIAPIKDVARLREIGGMP